MREISKQETKLIQGIMNGEKNAEIELIKRFKKGLIWLSKRKVENDQVDDIVQETFKNLFKSIRRGIIKPGIPLKDYIFGIFKKVLAEYIEAKKRMK
ncbi:hypothetical protein NLC29_03995 [Candidatus Aminicenantes bacterium AH-873-B07]|nr:hypothetical protein [Candidatus Aminicenantes bacterium AH-873-B07]